MRSALEFPSAGWVPLGFTRYGIILATIPPAFLFKNAEATYYFWPLLSAAVLAASLYLAGRRLFGAVAGVTAVVLTFTNAIVLYNLTRGYPDIMSMALVFAALVAALMARDRGFEGRAALLWLLATGLPASGGPSRSARPACSPGRSSWPCCGAVARCCARMPSSPRPCWGGRRSTSLISGVVYGDPLLKAHTLMGTNPTGVGNVPPPPPQRVDDMDRTRIGYFLAIPARSRNGPTASGSS